MEILTLRLPRRTLAMATAGVLAAALLVLVTAGPAQATHFRFRDLTWRFDHASTAGNVVELTMRVADRRSYYGGALTVGSSFSERVGTGDGGYETLTGEVVAVNAVDDWFIAEVTGFHTYPTAGPFTVSWDGCCTLSSLRNSPDSSLRTTTVINMSDGNTAAPVSLVSPIVHLPAASGVQKFSIPATDADGDNVGFRLATQAESRVTQPAGLSIDERTGVVSWDTTGRPDGLWMVTVVIGDSAGGSTMNTFLIKLGGTASASPDWVDPTPADRSNFSVEVGQPQVFTLAAVDPDGDAVHITPLNAPPGLSCSSSTEGPRTEVSCTWLPTANGSHLVAFDAQDVHGVSAGLRSYRLTAPRYVAMGDSYSSGQGAHDPASYEDGTDEESGNSCRRASTAYPELVGSVPWLRETLVFVACSGAKTYHFYEAQHPDHAVPQLGQFDMADLGQDVEVVTLTIGGNDVGFADILKECITGAEVLPFNDCSSDPEKSEYPVQDGFARLRGEEPRYGRGDPKTVPLAQLYGQIIREAPRARVLVVGYPQFFGDDGTTFACGGVSGTDQEWTNQKVEEMNYLLREEAQNLGLEFVPTTEAFIGHRLCEGDANEESEWFRGLDLDDRNASFHPDEDGHVAIAQKVLATGSNPPQPITLTTGEVRQFYIDFFEAETVAEWFSVIARWPGSDVEITVTSPSGQVYHRSGLPAGTRHLLGPTYEILQIPDPEPGRWKVELYGADMGADGEPVLFSTNVEPAWNYPPTPQIDYTIDGNRLHLNGTGSADTDGDTITGYRWLLRDEQGNTFAELDGPIVDYVVDHPGKVIVSLRVEDSRGKYGFAGLQEPISVTRYQITGPMQPLDPSAEWTTAQAGRTIPVRWRLTENGQPVADPASFSGLRSRQITCDNSSTVGDEIAGDTAGTSGLSYHGDGTWQYQWQTRRDWAGSCRLMTVDYDDGSNLTAKFYLR